MRSLGYGFATLSQRLAEDPLCGVCFLLCSVSGCSQRFPFPIPFQFYIILLFDFLAAFGIINVWCILFCASNLSAGFFFHVNLIMGSSNLHWFFTKCCRFTCGSYCWSDTGNRECWGNSWFVSCTCCLDILQPYKVITFQTPF